MALVVHSAFRAEQLQFPCSTGHSHADSSMFFLHPCTHAGALHGARWCRAAGSWSRGPAQRCHAGHIPAGKQELADQGRQQTLASSNQQAPPSAEPAVALWQGNI